MIAENEFLYSQTDEIIISACPVLLEEDATAQNVWGYYLCIENNSKNKISLVGKDWNITDDKGNRYSDDTAGFKGELPELEPGECFEYTSTAPLNSSNAVFYGSCKIKKEGQDKIEDVKIPTLFLTSQNVFKNSVLH